jgi:predicted dehydrogenase
MEAPLRVAILGAGLFAKDTIAPAVRALPNQFDVKAVFSRSEASTKRLAGDFSPKHVDVYFGENTREALSPLLARTDIDAVIIVLPIDAMV